MSSVFDIIIKGGCMTKIIHYCWFGPNPKPKLFYKCLKSWQKFLPDFEIKEWNESNSDLEANEFVKEAYKEKKWAFVSDYIRTKALYEEGGLYLDTDMEITAPIDDLLDDESFLGFEQSSYVAVGIWWEKKPKSFLTKKLLDKYNNISFNIKNIYMFAIPKLITDILISQGLTLFDYFNTQKVNDITIYSADYFYPIPFEHDTDITSKNTRGIHYYDASWVDNSFMLREKIAHLRKKTWFEVLFRSARFFYRGAKKILSFIKSIISRKQHIPNTLEERVDITVDMINKLSDDATYMCFYNSNWLGTANSTRDLFKNLINSGEIRTLKDVDKIVFAIIKKENIKQVIFSAFPLGLYDLIKRLKALKPDLKIKVYWHASNSHMHDNYSASRNMEIIELAHNGYIDEVAICKKSLVNFYNKKGISTSFLSNQPDLLSLRPNIDKKTNDKIRIGIYAADPRVKGKNLYNQMVAVSLVENVVLDVVPLSEEVKIFASLLNIELTGTHRLKRDDLLKRMALNDVNLYVTYTECAPMLPLESLEIGVPCITGNNHHYFNGKLRSYLVVNNESSPIAIKECLLKAYEHCDEINKTYMDIRQDLIAERNRLVKEFLDK